MEGQPCSTRPLFIWIIAEPWAKESAYSDLMTASLSMWADRCGSTSLHHSPDFPHCRNVRLEPSSVPGFTSRRRCSSEAVCPWRRFSSGL